jgi:hypothetical protein
MPTLTRWYIRISFLYLVAALLVAMLLALRFPLSLPGWVGGLGPVYFHLFLVGWVTQLIFGVSFWLFPRTDQEREYGWMGWITLAFLNAGLLLRALAEPLNASRPGTLWGWLLVPSALLQWLAGLGFVVMTWPRTRQQARKGR